MAQIVIFIPYPEMGDIFEGMREDCPLDFELIAAICEEAIPIAFEKISEGVKVFIARGETAKLLKIALQHSEAVVLEIPITDYDRICMITKAMAQSNKIAIVGFEVSRAMANFISNIVDKNIKIDFYHIDASHQINDMCSRIVKAGYEVIAGTPRVVYQAQKYGITGIPMVSTPATLRSTLEEAVKTTRIIENHYRDFSVTASPHTLMLDYNDVFSGADSSIDASIKNKISAKCKFLVKGENVYDCAISESGKKIHFIINCIDNVEKNVRAVCEFCEEKLEQPSKRELSFANFITESPALKRMLQILNEIAQTDATLLLQGETGTGKSLLAKIIHAESDRHHKPIISLNCAALPETLVESELFGYSSGAFTGSNPKGKKGYFSLANTGTIFLDEISELSLSAQAKILKIMEEKTFFPVGAEKELSVNTRIICAANKSLKELVCQNLFRQDLYYRLSVFEIHIPPLRERPEDIEPLALAFLERLNADYQTSVCLKPAEWRMLKNLNYPGNARQLRSLLERLVIGSKVGMSLVEILDEDSRGQTTNILPKLCEMEEAHIRKALQLTGNNKKKAANLLGISPATLWRKSIQFQLGKQ